MKEKWKNDKMVSGGFEPWTIGKTNDMKSVLTTTGVAIHPFIYFLPCYYIINELFEFEKQTENARNVHHLLQSSSSHGFFISQ